jgi:uncharacterized repeat protein (TIGR03803 family)
MGQPLASKSLSLFCAFTLALAILAALAPPFVHAQTYTVLHQFGSGKDGATPYGGVTLDAVGNLYGTTYAGGTIGRGTVYKIDTSGNETVLYSFGGPDGAQPYDTPTLDAAGNLYGTTYAGGAFIYYGTVFKLDATGKETVLHNFRSLPDGTWPRSSLTLDPSGNLYGTTQVAGPADYGIVFKLDNKEHETILHGFGRAPYTDGTLPEGGVVRDATGNLYGNCYSGTIYKINAAGKLSVLYTLGSGSNPYYPVGRLFLDASGDLYGIGYSGGTYGLGAVFKVNSSSGKQNLLYSFGGGMDGQHPNDGVVRDASGNLYGTTLLGGTFNHGTVYKLDTTGKETVLYSFTGATDGGSPYSTVVLDSAGSIYGTAPAGGLYGAGVVFKITP